VSAFFFCALTSSKGFSASLHCFPPEEQIRPRRSPCQDEGCRHSREQRTDRGVSLHPFRDPFPSADGPGQIGSPRRLAVQLVASAAAVA